MKTELDTPWKDVLDSFFQEFMELFFPDINLEIDWTKGYEFLDKELSKISKDTATGKRLVDKLIKVWCLNGQETWVLLHLEIQGQKEKDFQTRMFTYYYRLFDRYHKPIVSLAMLVDGQIKWRPTSYENSLWGCKIKFEFPVIKLIDFNDKRMELAQTKNPFGLIVLAHLAALETKQDENRRYKFKRILTRWLYKHGYQKSQIFKIYSFLDWVLALPKPLELQYYKMVEDIEEGQKVAYITSAERIGVERGTHVGEVRLLVDLILYKFAKIPKTYREKIEQANENTLKAWARRTLTAKTLKDVFSD